MKTVTSSLTLSRLAPRGDRPVWVRVGTLIDGTDAAPLRDAHLVYDAEAIRFVGAGDALPPRELLDAEQSAPVELPGHTVLPGLIEAHAHLFLEGAPIDFETRKAYLAKPDEALLADARRRLPGILRCGVLAVRDAGDNRGVGLALRRDPYGAAGADQGEPVPHYETPGPAIHHRGRYGSFMSTPLEEFASPEACVAQLETLGVDRVKLIATGIINFEKGKVSAPPQMTPEELKGFVEAARRRGLKTFAHSTGAEGIERVIAAGIDSVEHGYFVTREQLTAMRDRDIAWVPTLAPVQLQVDRAGELGWSDGVVSNLERILESHRERIRQAHEMGVAVLAGSDAGSCGVPHGTGLLKELELLEAAGLSAHATLQTATGKSAAALGLKAKQGILAAGCRSRLLFTAHDPLATVAHLRKEKTIVFDGRLISKQVH
jgi:imidazolonepropionase-like amidohydrolase